MLVCLLVTRNKSYLIGLNDFSLKFLGIFSHVKKKNVLY